jgi:hypothetical protein
VSLSLKDGVLVAGNKYTNAIMTATQAVYGKHGWDVVVTAGRDGKHSEKSLHYEDRALDIRFWMIPEDHREGVAAEIRARLPVWYDVVIEGDHYHIEADKVKEGKK